MGLRLFVLSLCLVLSHKSLFSFGKTVNSSTENVLHLCTRKAGQCAFEKKNTGDVGYEIGDEFIINFDTYRNVIDHVSTVYEIAGGCSDWRNVARENVAATRYPTDFLVLQIKRSGQPNLLNRLSIHPRINHFSKQRQITARRWLSKPPERNEANSTTGGGSGEGFARFRMMTLEPEEENKQEGDKNEMEGSTQQQHQRKLLKRRPTSIAKFSGAEDLWKEGYTGQGIRVAVFDTGLREGHGSFRNIVERTDWTDEGTLDDHIGHGTFVAGVISSTHSQCSGFAPDAEIHAFRVFNRKQVSYTSWFLDAFNYAMRKKVHILNLSIGGPDFLDRPFVEKVQEMSANGIVVVSAIGNDGPRYGTLNNPADQPDVIGVGGITYDDELAAFSSRGMTTWELPRGYGRVKPDIVAYGKDIRGPTMSGGCRSLSGTSVASPVVAGMVTLLAGLAELANPQYLNPAMMKQVIAHSAEPIPDSHVFEQGMGKVDLQKAADLVRNYKPRASTLPSRLDFTDCPYMWPYCTQPAYYSGMPLIANLTVLNALSVSGTIENPRLALNPDGFAGDTPLITASFTYSDVLWPWSGYLALSVTVTKAGISMSGVVSGRVVFDVVSDIGERSTVSVPLRVQLSPPPPRERRLLWDQFHNLRYPSGYFPRDNLAIKSDILDWNGDHIHTNFKDLYTHLRERGYFIEVLGTDWTCVDAERYGALLLVDPEEAYFDTEVAKITSDVYTRGLGLVVVAEWHNTATMKTLKFLDQNTQSWWLPQTGGANLPELNRVLEPFHIAFSDRILDATMNTPGGESSVRYESGSSILKFPKGGRLLSVQATDSVSGKTRYFPVAGIHSTGSGFGNGRVVVLGDSNCLDGNHRRGPPCYALFDALLDYACLNHTNLDIFPPALILESAYLSDIGGPPLTMEGVQFAKYSKVKSEDGTERPSPECLSNSATLPNVSHLTPAVNHSDFRPHLPAPGGGFHSNVEHGLPYFALGLFVGACALGFYVRFCRGVFGPEVLAVSKLSVSTVPNGVRLSTRLSEPLDVEPTSKWGRGGHLHKRSNGHKDSDRDDLKLV